MPTGVGEDRPEPISVSELQSRLMDIDVPDRDLRPYLMESASETGSFRPVVRINPAHVAAKETAEAAAESALALSSLNGIARWRRQQRYRRKVKDWNGARIVSEGDSWFQYPFLLDDVIDQLWDPYAIFSLDAAGDLLTDMVKQGEVVAAVVAEKPDLVLLSGGGNDLLGEARLAQVLPPYDPAREPADYLGERFEAHLGTVMKAYERVVVQIRGAAPNTGIVCHTYDYALPNRGRWLGKPMESIGIKDPALQKAIVRCCIDRFREELAKLAGRHGRMELVDCRGSVGAAQWFDELHPTNAGFASAARRFRATIGSMLAEKGGVESGGPALSLADRAPGKGEDVAAAAMFLARTYSEQALLHELGRRQAIVDAGAEVDGLGSIGIPDASVESFFPAFREAGKAIVDALHRQLYQVICGDGEAEKADRKALGEAMGVGEMAVVGAIATALGALSVPAAVCAIAAPILARRVVAPSVDALCGVWGKHLGAGDGDKAGG
jgi:hypothetical protein